MALQHGLIQHNMPFLVTFLLAVLLSEIIWENKTKNIQMEQFFFVCLFVSVLWSRWSGDGLYALLYVYLREVYGFKLSCKCAWMMNVYILLLVLKSSTNQQSQHVHFAKLYKIALIVKSSDHNIALTHQEVLPCEKHSLNFKHGKKRSKCKI